MPLRCGEVCRCSSAHHKPPTSLSIKMHSTFSNLFKRHRTTLASPYHHYPMEDFDLIGEVQHISSCILLRNQQPMRLHQNFILTNQIQIKKQADWLLSLSYHTNICLSSFLPFYSSPPGSLPTPFARNSLTYFYLYVLKITICHHTHHTNHNKKSQNLPICLNQ